VIKYFYLILLNRLYVFSEEGGCGNWR